MGSYATRVKAMASPATWDDLKADVLILPLFQKPEKLSDTTRTKASPKKEEGPAFMASAALDKVDRLMKGYLQAVLKAENFKAVCNKRRVVFVPPESDLSVRWVVVVGLGEPDKLTLPKATQALTSAQKDTFTFAKVHHIALVLPEGTSKVSLPDMARTATLAAFQATYKTAEADAKKIHALKTLDLLLPTGKRVDRAVVETARIMAESEALTKDLANRPANLKSAEDLAQAARALKSMAGIQVRVISDLKKLQQDMPAFWAVGQAAAKTDDPPRFIKVTYTPTGTRKIRKKIALVGKGVIFDTGGVQVKTGTYMNDMKFDMTGAATVIACVQAAAAMQLEGVQVSAYVAATRNLIGEEAYLPDSIIHSASGKKIEIRHTDAEGRVTLADSVHQATLDKPDEIVTIATLTGAAVMAVGHCIALMGTDEKLVGRLETACKAAGETVQKLDLLEEDFNNVKSDRDAADYSNVSKSRNRGHLSAGAFVLNFARDIPAAHLDIAGGDAKDGNATGIAVKGLIEYLRQSALSHHLP